MEHVVQILEFLDINNKICDLRTINTKITIVKGKIHSNNAVKNFNWVMLVKLVNVSCR